MAYWAIGDGLGQVYIANLQFADYQLTIKTPAEAVGSGAKFVVARDVEPVTATSSC